MEDCIDTTISMTPLQFQEYIPVPDDFETVYPQDRIKEIAEMFKACFTSVMQEQDGVKGKKKSRPLEKIVSDIWVCLLSTRWSTSTKV